MRALTPTPPQKRRHPPGGTPAANNDAPCSVAPEETPATLGVSTEAPPECLTGQQDTALPLTPESIPEDSVAEVLRLREEVARLKGELQTILDHTIESDTRLLQFTDTIFVANSPGVDTECSINKAIAIDCGVQCELGAQENSAENLTPEVAEELVAQERLQAAMYLPGSEGLEVIDSMKTTIEVLTVENQWLKQEAKKCNCRELNHNQPWIQVKNKKQKFKINTFNNFDRLQIEDNVPTIQQRQKIIKNKNGSSQQTNKRSNRVKSRIQNTRRKLRFQTVTILGDSHTRHLAGLVRDLVDYPATVSGFCKPGARLPDIINFAPKTPSAEAQPRCEVLIAGTNDLATGAQDTIYRHLERYATSRPAGTKVVIATLPQRHDLKDELHPIHDETVFVNAFIEELAARHHFQVLKLDGIARRHFTRHGQHLTMRGKRLVAELLVRSLCASVTDRPTFPRPTGPAPAPPSEDEVTRPGHRTFAEAVAGSPAVILSPALPEEREAVVDSLSVIPSPASSEEREVVIGSPSINPSVALPEEPEAVFLGTPLVNEGLD